jgi:hypothetical protein
MKKLRAYQCGREVVVAFNKMEATELIDRYDLFRNIATGKRDPITHPIILLKGDVVIKELDIDNHIITYDNREVFQISDSVNNYLNDIIEKEIK